MKNLNQDIKRYRELTNSSFMKEPSSIVIILFRISESVNVLKFYPLKFFLNIFIIPIYRIFSVIIGISIPRNCEIESGFVIYHYGSIAINELVVIGKNCTIRQGVTIGNKNALDDVPIIGDNVDIGAGAKILGKIRVGNNVSIGANAVVIHDVPDNCIAVGVPARICLKKEMQQ